MCTFAVAEPVIETNSVVYAQALLMIMLRFDLAHGIGLDNDSKFYAAFAQTCQLMNISVHTVSSRNHDPMIIERLKR